MIKDPRGSRSILKRGFTWWPFMNAYHGLTAFLVVGNLAIASPAWTADATDRPNQHPTTAAPAPTKNPTMMEGMSGMGQTNAAPNSTAPMMANCKQHMDGMRKNLGDMMGNIDDMMKNARSPDMQKRLQVMHDQMSAMMVQMQQMQGMMGSGMMRDGQEPSTASPTTPAPLAPTDHNTHHPNW